MVDSHTILLLSCGNRLAKTQNIRKRKKNNGSI
jgi:hypothetical protein